MCDIRVVTKEGGVETLLGENVTRLEVASGGVRTSSLFDGQKEHDDMVIEYIDFTEGKVVLIKK